MTKKGRSEEVETTGESSAVSRDLTVNIEQVCRESNVICGFAPCVTASARAGCSLHPPAWSNRGESARKPVLYCKAVQYLSFTDVDPTSSQMHALCGCETESFASRRADEETSCNRTFGIIVLSFPWPYHGGGAILALLDPALRLVKFFRRLFVRVHVIETFGAHKRSHAAASRISNKPSPSVVVRLRCSL